MSSLRTYFWMSDFIYFAKAKHRLKFKTFIWLRCKYCAVYSILVGWFTILQLPNSIYYSVYLEYWKTSNMSAAPPWWVHSLWIFFIIQYCSNTTCAPASETPFSETGRQFTTYFCLLHTTSLHLISGNTFFFVFIVLNQIMMKKIT